MTYNFNVTYAGAVYRGTGFLYWIDDNGNFKSVGVSYNGQDLGYSVALTGYWVKSVKGSIGWQTTIGRYIILSENWEKVGVISINKYSQSRAQALVDKIIKNNIQIVQNNLVCARYANKFTAEQQELIRDLQRRADSRRNDLKDDGLCSNVQTSYPKGYADLSGYLDKLMHYESIGIATWAVVVIVATVIAATATAAYFAYKSLADESEKDVKFSKELTAILAEKLTPEEYQQLLDETKGIVTKSKIKQAIRTSANWLMYAAVAVGGFAIYRLIKQRKQ